MDFAWDSGGGDMGFTDRVNAMPKQYFTGTVSGGVVDLSDGIPPWMLLACFAGGILLVRATRRK